MYTQSCSSLAPVVQLSSCAIFSQLQGQSPHCCRSQRLSANRQPVLCAVCYVSKSWRKPAEAILTTHQYVSLRIDAFCVGQYQGEKTVLLWACEACNSTLHLKSRVLVVHWSRDWDPLYCWVGGTFKHLQHFTVAAPGHDDWPSLCISLNRCNFEMNSPLPEGARAP